MQPPEPQPWYPTAETPAGRHHRWYRPRNAVAAAVAAAAVGASLIVAVHVSPPGNTPSFACEKATAAQNTFVDDAVAAGYPDVSVTDGLAVITADLKLLADMAKAGCRADTRIHALPAS